MFPFQIGLISINLGANGLSVLGSNGSLIICSREPVVSLSGPLGAGGGPIRISSGSASEICWNSHLDARDGSLVLVPVLKCSGLARLQASDADVRFGLISDDRYSSLQNMPHGITYWSSTHPEGPHSGISRSRVSGMIVNGWNRVDPFPPGFDISNSEPMPRLRYDGSCRNLSADPTAAIRRSRYCLSLGQRDCPGIPVIRRTQTVATVCGRLRFHRELCINPFGVIPSIEDRG